LWEVVAGTEMTAPDQNTHPDKHEEWLIKDQEACAQITLTLKDEPLSGVLYANSAVETWTKLNDKLSTEAVIAQVLVEEKSQQATKSHSALTAKTMKKKSKASEKKKTKKCTYAPCGLVGHMEENCRRKKADEGTKSSSQPEKDKPKEKTAKLSVKVAQVEHFNSL
ncbi:hypothetical protein PISMIDRAFT_687124, partial [Pisolithus microcarpus 441]